MAPIIELFRVLLLALIGAIVGQTQPPANPAAPMGLATLEPTESPSPEVTRVPHPFAPLDGESTLTRRVRIDAASFAAETLRTRHETAARAIELDDARSALEAALAAERLEQVGRPVRVIITEPCPTRETANQSTSHSALQQSGNTALDAFWFTGVLLQADRS